MGARNLSFIYLSLSTKLIYYFFVLSSILCEIRLTVVSIFFCIRTLCNKTAFLLLFFLKVSIFWVYSRTNHVGEPKNYFSRLLVVLRLSKDTRKDMILIVTFKPLRNSFYILEIRFQNLQWIQLQKL